MQQDRLQSGANNKSTRRASTVENSAMTLRSRAADVFARSVVERQFVSAKNLRFAEGRVQRPDEFPKRRVNKIAIKLT